MNLSDMIYKRKSCRSYTGEPVDQETLDKIYEFYKTIRPLYPDIRVEYDILAKDQVKCILPWITPQLMTIFSEDKEGFRENVGFIFQQLDLYMQSIGLGVCWLGMGKINPKEYITSNDNMKYVIMLALGHPKGDGLRSGMGEFKRRKLSDICDEKDHRLQVAQYAPSSVNSQPWYFTHEDNAIHLHCVQQGLFKVKTLGDMNRIDVGIALAHLYVANPDTFHFFKTDNVKPVKGYGYIGSFTI